MSLHYVEIVNTVQLWVVMVCHSAFAPSANFYLIPHLTIQKCSFLLELTRNLLELYSLHLNASMGRERWGVHLQNYGDCGYLQL